MKKKTTVIQEILDSSRQRLLTSRTDDFGEVYTPPKVVEQMLDLLDKEVWDDENCVFFEPTCGNGNFVIGIIKRRLSAFFKKEEGEDKHISAVRAVMATVDNLWAMDILSDNVRKTRKRAKRVITEFLLENGGALNSPVISFAKETFEWQIQHNEALTALQSTYAKALEVSKDVKASRDFLNKYGHRPIDFEKTYRNNKKEEL